MMAKYKLYFLLLITMLLVFGGIWIAYTSTSQYYLTPKKGAVFVFQMTSGV